jgi:hypothetical protein
MEDYRRPVVFPVRAGWEVLRARVEEMEVQVEVQSAEAAAAQGVMVQPSLAAGAEGAAAGRMPVRGELQEQVDSQSFQEQILVRVVERVPVLLPSLVVWEAAVPAWAPSREVAGPRGSHLEAQEGLVATVGWVSAEGEGEAVVPLKVVAAGRGGLGLALEEVAAAVAVRTLGRLAKLLVKVGEVVQAVEEDNLVIQEVTV